MADDNKILDGTFKEMDASPETNPEENTPEKAETPKEKGRVLKAIKAGANKVLDIRLRDILLATAIVGGAVGLTIFAIGFATKGETEETQDPVPTPDVPDNTMSDVPTSVETVEF